MGGTNRETFPIKLFKVLWQSDTAGYSPIILWLPHGRAFMLNDINRFEKEVMKKFFFQSKFQSFEHQLCIYGFQKNSGIKSRTRTHFHPLFLRDRIDLCKHIPRYKTGSKENISVSPFLGEMPDLHVLPSPEASNNSTSLLAVRPDDIS